MSDRIALEEGPCLVKNQGCLLLLPTLMVDGAVSGETMTTGQQDVGPFSSPYWLHATPGKPFYALRMVFSSLKMGVVSLPADLPQLLWCHQ